MGSRKVSPGKIYEYNEGMTPAVNAKLYNFEIGKFDVKTEHSDWLNRVVAPKLMAGGSMSIAGLTSRTGSDASNMTLSQNRINAMVDLLRRQVPNNFQIAIELAMGERAALLAGMKDGKESEAWRAVVISVWDKPTPPPPPPPPPVQHHVDMTWNHRWLGIGVKSGGQLLIGGVESVTAYVVCLGDMETFDLKIVSRRLGLGLGGGVGIVAIIGYGFSVPYELDGDSLDDWGVNIAFTEKIISQNVVHSIQASKYFIDGVKNGLYVAPKIKAAGNAATVWKILTHVRDGLHVLYSGLEGHGQKGIVVLDLPGAGWGLELSGFVTHGTMYIDNPSGWSGGD